MLSHEARIRQGPLVEGEAMPIAGHSGLSSVLEKLAPSPAPEHGLAPCPAEPLQERIRCLLEKNRTAGSSLEDQLESDLNAGNVALVFLSVSPVRETVMRFRNWKAAF